MSNMKNISLYINYIAQNLEKYDIFSNFAERNKKCNKKPFFSLDSYRIIF
jgi:hypothetical protein